MKRIEFDEPDSDAWRKWRRKCDRENRKYFDTIAKGDPYKIKGLYKEQKDLFRAAEGPFSGRCAYCEASLGNQHGEIEHYRPKGAVLHEDHSPVTRMTAAGEETHIGYQWLAYDWTNLLLACVACNQIIASGSGKGCRFPVEGEHAWIPEEIAQELPKLINPVTEDPRFHLEINLDTGVLHHKTERGRATIDVFGLNDRGLPKERFDAIRSVQARVTNLLSEFLANRNGPVSARFQDTKAELLNSPYASAREAAWDSQFSVLKAVVAEDEA